jgi:hypothetical protein
MPRAIPTSLAAAVGSLGEADLLPFQEPLNADMVDETLKAEEVRSNRCIDTPIVTLCLSSSCLRRSPMSVALAASTGQIDGTTARFSARQSRTPSV